MMEKRLAIAKKLLNPADSVLIVTIDEKEYLHLGCLLEEMFPSAKMQMITSVISRNGTSRENEFSRVEEYLFILRFGSMGVTRTNDNMLSEEGKGVISRVWFNFMRTSTPRSKTKGQFFPIFINPTEKRIVQIGSPLGVNEKPEDVLAPEGLVPVFPIRDDNTEATWGAVPTTTKALLQNGYLRVGSFDESTQRWSIQYVRQGDQKRVKSGEIVVEGVAADGSLLLAPLDATRRTVYPKTVWNRKTHDATEYGTRLLKPILINTRFSYPKSLYAVADTIRFFVKEKPSALVLDFFAGSGTTLHAVNLLNGEDGGKRRCILVTNNEVSNDEAVELSKRGFYPGDEEWERYGIARYVTWARNACAIDGKNVIGQPLSDTYQNTGAQMSAGFKTNFVYFKLGFLDKTNVALGRQLRELLPLIWMKSGCNHRCPSLPDNIETARMLILPKNRFAVLIDEAFFDQFVAEISGHPEIESVFIVTNSDIGYQEMALAFENKQTYQLYRDYLDNFRLNFRK